MPPRPIVGRAFSRWILALLLLGASFERAYGGLLEQIESKLSVNLFQDRVRLRLNGLLDFEGYFLDQPTPALIYAEDDFLFNPRLTVFLDAQIGSHLSAFAQVRVDRAFDPTDDGAELRLDDYAIILSPWKDNRLTLKAGKFATVIGNWVPRHYSWENPFINAPLPYENLTAIWDTAGPRNVDHFLAWGHVGEHDDGDYSDKHLRNPVIWGPAYGTGFAISGSVGRFDYAAEIKNAALTSRPEHWDLTARGLENPTFSGRVGLRPNEMWNLGLSGSAGPYLLSGAAPSLPAGRSFGDYRQFVISQDASFAWRHLQLWAEVFASRFEVPNVGDADVLTYYLEAKYKITAQLFAALRWNQQFFGTISDEGNAVPWGNDISRGDAVVGYRFTNYLQLKAQYSLSYEAEALHRAGHVASGQLTVKF